MESESTRLQAFNFAVTIVSNSTTMDVLTQRRGVSAFIPVCYRSVSLGFGCTPGRACTCHCNPPRFCRMGLIILSKRSFPPNMWPWSFESLVPSSNLLAISSSLYLPACDFSSFLSPFFVTDMPFGLWWLQLPNAG